MSQRALRQAGASSAPSAPRRRPRPNAVNTPPPATTGEALAREARWLADTAAAFSLFGLALEAPPAQAIAQAERAPMWSPSRARKFPRMERRGVHIPPRLAISLLPAFDWIVIALAAEFAARWGYGAGLGELALGQAGSLIAAALSLKAGLWLTETYRVAPARLRPERGVGGLALGAILGLAVATFAAPDARTAGALAALLPFAAMLMAGLHAALAVWIKAAHRRGLFSETVVVIGATEAAQRFIARAQRTGDVRVVALADDRYARGGEAAAGDVASLIAWAGLPHVDRIVIALSHKAEARVRDVIERLQASPNRVDLLLDFDVHSVHGVAAEKLNGVAVACVSGRPACRRRALVKRALDLALGTLLLTLLAAPMLGIALAIKHDSKGSVLFRQRRHGFNNRPFTLLKFRSLEIGGGGPTRVGAFLRRYGLDELPQLINVLKGEMSLVGPRPHAVGMRTGARAPETIVAAYAQRHRVKPGITGWAQINGARGGVKTPAALRQRVKLDLDYVAKASLWMDLGIIARTPAAMWTGGGAR
jgi:exopolysaccharide biosynthesis polyprenyl glycosylphosphotransferase